MKRIIKIVLSLSVLAAIFATTQFQSCHYDPVGIDTMRTVCFEGEILPLLKNTCGMSGCHDGSSEGSGHFVVTDYASIVKHVKPGNAKQSQLYKVLGSPYGNIMPPDRPLSQANRTLIEIWIQQGAKDTKCDTSGNVPSSNEDSVCFVQSILPILKSSCGITGCHDEISHQEGYTLTSYTTLRQHSGAIVAYHPEESKIYQVMVRTGEEMMPPSGQLASVQIETFRKWVAQGALNSD